MNLSIIGSLVVPAGTVAIFSDWPHAAAAVAAVYLPADAVPPQGPMTQMAR